MLRKIIINNTRKTAIDEPGNAVGSERVIGEPIRESEFDEDIDGSPLKEVESFRNAEGPSKVVSAILILNSGYSGQRI